MTLKSLQFKNYNYSVLIIVDNEIVGITVTEIVGKEEFNNNNIKYDNLNLYISSVDIREDYQGLGLQGSSLSFLIKNSMFDMKCYLLIMRFSIKSEE